MPSTLPPQVRFANFEVDLRAGELHRDGSKVRLQEQPFLLLTVLMESAGEVVSREELRNRLWSADTFVDFDHRLAVAVNKLRDALRDSVEKPRFVETVGRRGYRFLGQLEFVDSTVVDFKVGIESSPPAPPQPAADAEPLKPPTTGPARSRVAPLAFLLAALLGTCLSLIVLPMFFHARSG
jgi:DNA-binding winged helix-turn-helix (wHTH) protein